MARALVSAALASLLLSTNLVAQASSANAPRPFMIVQPKHAVLAGTVVPLDLYRAAGSRLTAEDWLDITWDSSDPLTAWVDDKGVLVLLKPGKVTISARQGAYSTSREIFVRPNPVRRLALTLPQTVGIGDTIPATIEARDERGLRVAFVRPSFAVIGDSGSIDGEGRFVAHRPGTFVIVAYVGSVSAISRVQAGDAAVAQQSGPTEPALSHFIADAALRLGDPDVRVGKPVQVILDAWAAGGRRVDEPQVLYAVSTASGSTTSAMISDTGEFIALEPGVYTIVVTTGERAEHQTVFVRNQ